MNLDDSFHSINEIRDALINLYLSVKIRKSEDISNYDEDLLTEEKTKLQNTDIILIINYIKTSIEILLNLKDEEEKNNKEETSSLRSEKSPLEVQNGYNEMLQNLENEIRAHIRVYLFYIID